MLSTASLKLIPIIVGAVILVGLTISTMYLSHKVDALKMELATEIAGRKSDNAIYNDERLKAAKTIYDQAQEIAEFKRDAVILTNTIKEKDKQISAKETITKVQIVKEMIRDPSCENKLRIMGNQMREFLDER